MKILVLLAALLVGLLVGLLVDPSKEQSNRSIAWFSPPPILQYDAYIYIPLLRHSVVHHQVERMCIPEKQ